MHSTTCWSLAWLSVLLRNLRTLTQNLFDDVTGVAWTEEDFEQSLESRNLWREVWPEAGIKFQRARSTQPTPPPGPPPARAIGPIATAPIGSKSIASISSSSAIGGKTPTAKAMPPSRPTRPAPKPKESTPVKEEKPQEEAVDYTADDEETEGADVKKEEVTAPPGLGLVDELQAMTPAQKKARIHLFQLTKRCVGHIG